MENLSLYNITNGFAQLMSNEEITEDDKLKIKEELTVLLQQKSANVIGFTKNLELTIEAMKNEEKRISENRKTLENKLAKFMEYIKECMENADVLKVETTLGTLSIAKNPISVEIINEDEIPSEFKQEVITTKIDKKAITDNFKTTGELIPGVQINTNKTSLRIK